MRCLAKLEPHTNDHHNVSFCMGLFAREHPSAQESLFEMKRY